MSVTVEKLEGSMAKLTIEVDAAAFTRALDKVYSRKKNEINIQGFRRGKAPRKIIEKMYGPVFHEDAANDCINATYEAAVKECGEDIVSGPEIGVEQLKEGEPFIYTATVALRPPVTLGTYRGVEITRHDPVDVTDEDVQKELERQQDANGKIETVTDRPVENRDMIKLDFAGTVDGEAFDGGTATDYDLTVGSGSFIPGFEEQLVGMAPGEEKDVVVTFPENYGEASLAGKEAVFHCVIKEIRTKVLPELDDDFADEVSEFETLEEYKANIRENLLEQKTQEQRTALQNEAVAAAVADAGIDIPEPMLRTQAENIASEFEQNLKYQYGGMDLNTYLQYMGSTYDAFLENLKPQAEQRIRNSLVLAAVAEAEGLAVSEEEFEAEYQKMADQYKMSVDNVKNAFSSDEMKKNLETDLLAQKAADLITDLAVQTKEPVSAAAEEETDEAEAEEESAEE